MPWTGSAPNQVFTRSTGNKTGATAWAQEKAAGTDVEAEVFDTHDQDIAAGISACLKKDGGNSPSADIPMAGNLFTGVGDGTARNHFASVSQIQDGALFWYGTVSGTDTYTVGDNGFSLTAYVDGIPFMGRFTNANTGAATLNIAGIGVTDLVDAIGNALNAGHIAAGSLHLMVYNSSNSKIHIISSNNLTVPNSRTLTAGLGISGGGNLSADRSFALDTSELSTEDTIDIDSDTFPFYDTSESGDRKNTIRKLVSEAMLPSWIILDSAGSGSAAPTASTGSWTKRSLDSSAHRDNGNGALVSLSSSVMRLAAGTHKVIVYQPIDNVGLFRMRWENTSDGFTEGLSLSTGASNSIRGTMCIISSPAFTIATEKNFELQYYAQSAGKLGPGTVQNTGESHYFCQIEGYYFG